MRATKIVECRQIIERLDEYLDGTLGNELSVEYQQHLEECQSCQKLGKQMLKIKDRYRINVQAPFLALVPATK